MDWADYLRDQAAKYRQLAETAEELSVKEELLDWAAICEEGSQQAEKPTFVRVSVSDGVPRWLKVSAAIAAVVGAVFTALAFFFAGGVSAHAFLSGCPSFC